MRNVRSILCVVVLLGNAGAVLGQNLVTNHSFESPAFNPSYPPLVATGWVSDTPNNMFIDNTASYVSDGSQYQQIGGSLTQQTETAVVPGTIYRLEFDFVSFGNQNPAARAQVFTNPNSTNDITREPGSQTLLDQELANLPTSTLRPFSFDFTAPAEASGFLRVQFLPGFNFRGIDNVRFTVVPEPAVLAGIGLGSLLLTRRRSRKV